MKLCYAKSLLVALISSICFFSCTQTVIPEINNDDDKQEDREQGDQEQTEDTYLYPTTVIITTSSYDAQSPSEGYVKYEYSYDSKNRLSGMKGYTNGRLYTENKDYYWGKKNSSYSSYSYDTDGNVSAHYYYENTYLDMDYKIVSTITISHNEEAFSKTEYYYDSNNRVKGVKGYSGDKLLYENIDYVWEDKKSSYSSYYYNNGEVYIQYNYNVTYLDEDYKYPLIETTKTIMYNTPTLVESTSRVEFSYDSDKRLSGEKKYFNEKLEMESKEYLWGDKKSSYSTFNYGEKGDIVSKIHCEYTYK